VTIPVTLASNGSNVGGTSDDISFDNATFSIAPASDCVINPAIGPGTGPNKQLSAGRVCSNGTGTCTTNADCASPNTCSLVRVGIFGLNTTTIPDGQLFTCRFTIGGAASPGVYPLGNSCAAADPNGITIPGTTCGAGGITVQGGIPTNTPTRTPTASYTSTPTNTPTNTPTGGTHAPAITVGTGAAAPGATVTIPVTLTGNGSTVGGTSDDIDFDSSLFSIAPADCVINPAIGPGTAPNKQLSAGKVCSNGSGACTTNTDCTSPNTCNIMRVGIFGLNTTAIPDGQLFTCRFTINAATLPGVYPLSNGCAAADPNGITISGTTCGAGSITVQGGIPTNTPTRTPTGSYTSTPTNTPTPTPTGTVATTLNVPACTVLRPNLFVPLTTSNAITVGSTDTALTFDSTALQCLSAVSSTLSGFTWGCDNTAGRLTTASASGTGDVLSAGATLFTGSFSVSPPLPRQVTIGIVDADGVPPNDFGGVPPPIPPAPVLWTAGPGPLLVGVPGDADCSGALTAVDASVILCRFVGRCRDSDFPPPCNDPSVRVCFADWDCSGTVTPQDASIGLAVLVGRIRASDTPLWQGCPQSAPSGQTIRAAAAQKSAAIDLDVSDATGAPGDEVAVEVRTRQAVTLGSTDLVLRYDRRLLEALAADSATLTGFDYHIDSRRGLVRTASATAGQDTLGAGDLLFRVLFRVRGNTRRQSSLLRLFDGDHRTDLAGPVGIGGLPESIRFTAHSGHFRLVR
jgi:hypothetical protein